MSLAQAVRFRWLEAQLTITECHEFINKLLDQNRDMIMKALCNQILKDTNEQQNNGNQINNIISQIIQSRKKKPKPIAVQNIKLDQLPKRLIGAISSFLDQYDYFDFSFTNRFVYLGCNRPNMLHELDLSSIENYSTINLKLFKSLKYLALTLTQCEELIPAINDLSHMNQLKTITISDIGQTDANIAFDTFLTSNFINNDNITKLECYDVGNANDFFPTAKFMTLLAKFPKIKYLSFNCAYLDSNINVNTIKNLYPKLKGLSIFALPRDIDRELIQEFGNNLDFLQLIEYKRRYDYNLENINFRSLQQLFLNAPQSKSVNDILKTAKNLKKVGICTHLGPGVMTEQEMKDAIANIIILCKSLEFIQFRDNGKYFTSILDGIERGLFETKNLKRNEIKIHIRIIENEFEPADFIFNVGKIIVLLDYSQINDFMFIWELRDLNNENKNILLEKLKTQCSSSNIVIGLFDNRFIITNNECKINGFDESWKMKGFCI